MKIDIDPEKELDRALREQIIYIRIAEGKVLETPEKLQCFVRQAFNLY